jgi:hypothetical protein
VEKKVDWKEEEECFFGYNFSPDFREGNFDEVTLNEVKE